MKYVTLVELMNTLRKNFRKVPHDVDFVLGVPRSGIICASVISEFLNVPLLDVDSFCAGAKPTGGGRLHFHKDSGRERKRVLVVDDTIYRGESLRKVRQKLQSFANNYEFTYLVVYLEGPCTNVDVWLEDLRGYTKDFPFVLYEWNIFHHITHTMSRCLYDMDGVLCVDPPDERNKEAYQEYIKNAIPLFTPSNEIGEIVSYRLSSNEGITRRWLDEHNVFYKHLTLFPAKTYEERARSGVSPEMFKAEIYRQRNWAQLFVESNDAQAKKICSLSGKPVYCVETNMLYQ